SAGAIFVSASFCFALVTATESLESGLDAALSLSLPLSLELSAVAVGKVISKAATIVASIRYMVRFLLNLATGGNLRRNATILPMTRPPCHVIGSGIATYGSGLRRVSFHGRRTDSTLKIGAPDKARIFTPNVEVQAFQIGQVLARAQHEYGFVRTKHGLQRFAAPFTPLTNNWNPTVEVQTQFVHPVDYRFRMRIRPHGRSGFAKRLIPVAVVFGKEKQTCSEVPEAGPRHQDDAHALQGTAVKPTKGDDAEHTKQPEANDETFHNHV